MSTQDSAWWATLDTHFNIDRILNPERLKDARKTGFAWCSHPGAVVVAVNRMYFERAMKNPNVAVIVAPESAVSEGAGQAVIVSAQAHELFLYVHNLAIHGPEQALPAAQIHETAVIAESARIGAGVQIGENARVGEQVTIQGPAEIGAGTVVDPGVVIGCEGLFAKRISGKLRHVRHFGGVRIGRDCFIHSGAIVVRSANYGEFTELADAVHIGIHTNVGHDVVVGPESVVSSHVVIAGRARLGANVWLGASATISNMVNVGDDARVNIGAVCLRDVAAGAEVSGNFALEHRRVMRKYLAEMRDAGK